MKTSEYKVTGWPAAVLMVFLLSIPLGMAFAAGFVLGRVS